MDQRSWNLAARAVLLVSVVVTGIGTFLPFASSGQRSRSSYELVSVARRLELVPDRLPGAVIRLWFAIPLLLVLCWLLIVTGRTRAGAWCGAAAAGITAAGLASVARSPLSPSSGWTLALGGTLGIASSATVVLVTGRRGARRARAGNDTS